MRPHKSHDFFPNHDIIDIFNIDYFHLIVKLKNLIIQIPRQNKKKYRDTNIGSGSVDPDIERQGREK